MQIDPSVYPLIALPIIGALIGWLTNRLAIQMLFRPRSALNLLGFKIQGLIPKRQKDLAAKVGQVVEEEILGRHLIRQEMEAIDLDPYLEKMTDRIIWDRVAPRLRGLPLLGSFVNDSIVNQLHSIALEAMRAETAPILDAIATEAEKRIAIRRLIEEKVKEFDLDQLEQIIRSLANREFKAIEVLGAIIGFLIGIAQMAIISIL